MIIPSLTAETVPEFLIPPEKLVSEMAKIPSAPDNIVPVLLYSRDNYDFSDSVITKLNANRPAATPTPAASAPKPAASANTPATTVKPAGDLGKKP